MAKKDLKSKTSTSPEKREAVTFSATDEKIDYEIDPHLLKRKNELSDRIKNLKIEHENLIKTKKKVLNVRLDKIANEREPELDKIKSQISEKEKELIKVEEKFSKKEDSVAKRVDDEFDPRINKILSELEIKDKNLEEIISKVDELALKKKGLMTSVKDLKKSEKLAKSIADKSKVLSTRLEGLPDDKKIDDEYTTQLKNINAKLGIEQDNLDETIKSLDEWTIKNNDLSVIIKDLKKEHKNLIKEKNKALSMQLDEVEKEKKPEINEIKTQISGMEKELIKVGKKFSKKEAVVAKEVNDEFDSKINKILSETEIKTRSLSEVIKNAELSALRRKEIASMPKTVVPKTVVPKTVVPPKRQIAAEARNEVKECPACRKYNKIQNKFCSYCGLELSRIEAVMTRLSEVAKKEIELILKEKKTRKMTDEERECPKCGDIIKKKVKFCTSCGKLIGNIPESGAKAVLKPKKVIAPKKKTGVKGEAAAKGVLSEAEKKEVEKTESEMEIEKKEVLCVVHRGPIVGNIYLCPDCMTYYCVKCAKALKEKGEACWSCEKEIDIAISEEEIKQRIQDYEVRLDSLKITVKNLDESFFTGAISKEEYKKMKDSLTEKIGVLLREIQTYKS